MTDKKIVLQIKGLRLEAVRGGSVIVDNISVTLHAGEVLGLIGESGAGKSTIGLSSMAYARAGVQVHARAIGAAMRQRVSHSPKNRLGVEPGVRR